MLDKKNCYTLTVKIACSGTILADRKTGEIIKNQQGEIERSVVGHMWYLLEDSSGRSSLSFGFSPVIGHEGGPFALGYNYRTDDTHYTKCFYQ